MPRFHRFYIPNTLVIITCVTNQRIPYFRSSENITLVWKTMRMVQEASPYRLLAYVILPDHLHFIIRTPESQPDFSRVVHSIKRNFTINYKKANAILGSIQLWQARFWDHIIGDDDDLARHIDYIHWNPVKHGYVSELSEW